ncbi:MAG TPA: hypothetical protein PKK43_06060 [Spirochaetota bacterium]|nr:hypothetical protein [Spirochaetota bacterium]
MAYIVLNSFIKSLSGRVDDLVFYAYGGKQYARRYVVPKNPDTVVQKKSRRRFAEAVAAWQDLTDSSKESWNRRCRNLSLSGYNLFISEYLLADRQTNKSRAVSGSVGFSSYMIRSHSVSGTLSLRFWSGSGSILLPTAESPG